MGLFQFMVLIQSSLVYKPVGLVVLHVLKDMLRSLHVEAHVTPNKEAKACKDTSCHLLFLIKLLWEIRRYTITKIQNTGHSFPEMKPSTYLLDMWMVSFHEWFHCMSGVWLDGQ